MSLYNMVLGMNAGLVVTLSPFLPLKADDFPRFRDIFTGADDTDIKGDIYVYTRMGGGNRDCWESGESDCSCPACEADRLDEHPQCAGRYDDDFDCTYSTFVWEVRDVDRADFEAVIAGRFADLSDSYKKRLKEQRADGGEKMQALLSVILGTGEAS